MNTINQIQDLVKTAEKFRHAYFWKSPSSAHERRSYEKYNSIAPFEWDEGGHHFSASYTVSCSCQNIYAYGEYYKDGNKTTLTAVKNSLKRLESRGK